MYREKSPAAIAAQVVSVAHLEGGAAASGPLIGGNDDRSPVRILSCCIFSPLSRGHSYDYPDTPLAWSYRRVISPQAVDSRIPKPSKRTKIPRTE